MDFTSLFHFVEVALCDRLDLLLSYFQARQFALVVSLARRWDAFLSFLGELISLFSFDRESMHMYRIISMGKN